MIDGSIVFQTEMSTEGFARGALSLEKRVNGVLKSMEKMGVGIRNTMAKIPQSITSGEKQLVELKYTIEELERELAKMGQVNVRNDEFFKLSAEYDKLTGKLETMRTKQKLVADEIRKGVTVKGLSDNGYVEDLIQDDKAWKKLSFNITNAERQLAALDSQRENMNLGGVDTAAYSELNAKLTQAKAQYSELNAKLTQAKAQHAEINTQLEATRDNTDAVGAGTRNLADRDAPKATTAIVKLGSMFKLMVIRMGLRALINQMRQGFSNLAQYSGSFNRSMSEMKSSLSALRNSLAAAFAPIVETCVPYLAALVDWLTAAMNALAKFFAALSGKSSYTKATKAAESYAAAANGVADANERGARSFDELNSIDSGSGAGAGGAGGANVGDMFETVAIDEKFMAQLDNILLIVESIAAVLLAWKISDAFNLGARQTAGIALAIAGSFELVRDTIRALNEGVTFDNLIQMLLDLGEITLGLGLAFGKTGAAIGLIVGGLALLGAGIKDLMTNGYSPEALAAAILGLLAVGGGIALAIGSWAPLIIGAIAGLFALIITGFVENWEEIKKIWNEKFEDWKEALNSGKPWWEIGVMLIEGLLNGIKETAALLWDWFMNKFWHPLWENIKKFLGINSPSTLFYDLGVNMLLGLWNGIKSIAGSIWGVFTDIWNGIKNIFAPVAEWFKTTFSNAWAKVKEVFSAGGKIFDGIKDGIETTFKKIVNKLIDGINRIIAFPFNKINSLLGKIRNAKILGVQPFGGIGSVSVPQIPKLASGAVIPPNREFLAILGDQKRGTNIETPEGLLRQIVREELGDGDNRPIYINVRLSSGIVKRILLGTLRDIRRTSGVEVNLT